MIIRTVFLVLLLALLWAIGMTVYGWQVSYLLAGTLLIVGLAMPANSTRKAAHRA